MNDANTPVTPLKEVSANPTPLTRSAIRKLAREAAEIDCSVDYEHMGHAYSSETDDSDARLAKANAARAANPEFEALMVEYQASMNEMARQRKKAVDAGEVEPMWWEKATHEEMLRRQRSAESTSAGSWDSGHIPTAESQNRSHAFSEPQYPGASTHRKSRRSASPGRSLWDRETEFRLLRKEMIAESKYRAMAPYGTFDVAAFQDEPKPDLQSDEEIDSNSAVPGNFPPHQHVSGLAELGTYLASSAYVVSLGGPPLPDMKYGIIVVPIGDEGLLFQGHGDHASRPPDLDKQIYAKSKELDRQEGEEELRKQTEAIKPYNNGEDIEDPLEDYERSFYRQRWVKRMEREGWYRNGAPIKYDDIFQHGKSEAPGLDQDHQDNFESRRQSYADHDFDAHHPPERPHSIAEVEDMIPEAGKALESLLTWEEPKQKPSRFRRALKSLLGINKSSNRKKTVTASRDLLVSVLVGIRELTYGHEPVNPGIDPDIWQAALKKFGPAAHGG